MFFIFLSLWQWTKYSYLLDCPVYLSFTEHSFLQPRISLLQWFTNNFWRQEAFHTHTVKVKAFPNYRHTDSQTYKHTRAYGFRLTTSATSKQESAHSFAAGMNLLIYLSSQTDKSMKMTNKLGSPSSLTQWRTIHRPRTPHGQTIKPSYHLLLPSPNGE